MTITESARALGRRGGLRRAQRLSPRRRAEIARIGARARVLSLRLAEAIQTNFDYVNAIQQLYPPPKVRSGSLCRQRLPGVYGPDATT
jgi:hypothetical protein